MEKTSNIGCRIQTLPLPGNRVAVLAFTLRWQYHWLLKLIDLTCVTSFKSYTFCIFKKISCKGRKHPNSHSTCKKQHPNLPDHILLSKELKKERTNRVIYSIIACKKCILHLLITIKLKLSNGFLTLSLWNACLKKCHICTEYYPPPTNPPCSLRWSWNIIHNIRHFVGFFALRITFTTSMNPSHRRPLSAFQCESCCRTCSAVVRHACPVDVDAVTVFKCQDYSRYK